MIKELLVDDSIIPMSELTVIYGGDREPFLKIPGSKYYNFLQDRNVTLSNLVLLHEHSIKKFKGNLNLADKAIECARAILGLRSLKFNYESRTFENDGLDNQTIGNLSTGTANAIAVCSIIMNPTIFGGKNNIIYINHPETCIHPKSCSALGRLIVEFYSANLITEKNVPQIIVNTWNDHIINGMRVGVKKLQDENTDFFTLNFTMKKLWHSIYIKDNGSFTYWPENFQDQWEKDLMKLI